MTLILASGCAPRAAGPPREEVDGALERGIDYLWSQQEEDGSWAGPLLSDASITAGYVLLMRYLDRPEPSREAKAAAQILDQQGPDGGWPIYPGAGGDLDLSVLCYLALKLAGVPGDHDAMARARSFVLAAGGAEQSGLLSRSFLTYFGQLPWSAHPEITTDVLRLGRVLYRAGLVRRMLIPLAILYENRHVAPVPPGRDVRELFLGQPSLEDPGAAGEGGCCEAGAVRWLVERQDPDGNWASVFNFTMVSLMALHATGEASLAPHIERGLAGVGLYQIETETRLVQQFTRLTVMDTANTIRALIIAGVPAEDPRLARAVAWLVAAQQREPGDWAVLDPGLPPGAWAADAYGRWFPDVDDTFLALMALACVEESGGPSFEDAVARAVEWSTGMQNRNGGWAAYDHNAKDPSSIFPGLGKLIQDFADAPSADVTARGLAALTAFDLDPGDPALRAARRFVLAEQEDSGAWFGRWAVGYVYGASQAIQGLLLAGSPASAAEIQEALRWLLEAQNADGGWGEDARSHLQEELAGEGPSTSTQTAMVLAALLRAGEARSSAAASGIRYLLHEQQADGSWSDEAFIGINVPGRWYYAHPLLAAYSAVEALGLYRRREPAHPPGSTPPSLTGCSPARRPSLP